MGDDTERLLIQVGIHTVEELRDVGSREAWLRIQSIDPSACLSRLSALEGAIQGVRWQHLPPEVRSELKDFCGAHRPVEAG
jgi:DNA transformation protein